MTKIELELNEREVASLEEFLRASSKGNPYEILIGQHGYEDGKEIWGRAREIIWRALGNKPELLSWT